MISLGAPFAMVTGVLLALGVAGLHLLAPRPPEREPLPTARFLQPEPRTQLRFRRRPTDVQVMVVRMLLALLLGLLFAQPRWSPERDKGVTRVVLLDVGAGMEGGWDAALAATLAETDLPAPSGAAPRLLDVRVVAYGAAGVPTAIPVHDSAALQALQPDDRESSYLAAFRALRATLADVGTEEAEAVLITRPRWSAWDPQLAGLRTAAWPGVVRVVAVEAEPEDPAEDTAAADSPDSGPPPSPDPGSPSLAAALATLGYEMAPSSEAGAVRFQPADGDLDTALDHARRGDTVVVHGGAGEGSATVGGRDLAVAPPEIAALWDGAGWPRQRPPTHLHVASRALSIREGTFITGRAVAPTDSAVVLPIVLDDGAPVAAARRTGRGCVVRFGASIDAAADHPSYPRLVGALRDGCRTFAPTTRLAPTAQLTPAAQLTPEALDSRAAAVLEGSGPGSVTVAGVGPELGRSLTGWVLLLTALVALLESVLVWRIGSRAPTAIAEVGS